MRIALSVLALAVALPSPARACPLVIDGNDGCGDDIGVSFEIPTAMCLQWFVIDGGEAYGFEPCDGSELNGGPSPGHVTLGFALELDGALVGGSASGALHKTVAPIVVARRDGRILLTRDWTSASQLYRWRKEFMSGAAKPRSVTLIAVDGDGKETARAPLTGCVPSSWTLQAGATDAWLEVVELTCDKGTEQAVRRLRR